MTTANKITITRIMMIPVFVLFAVYYGRSRQHNDPQEWLHWTAVAIWVLAAASDGLDGYIARRYNQKSRLGVILDPIADKGLLLTGIITLSFSNWDYEFPAWFAILVIARDIIVIGGAITLHLLNGKVQVRPSWTGKAATALQMVALTFVMLQLNFFEKDLFVGSTRLQITFLDIPVWIAAIFTTVSGVGYVIEGIRQLHAEGHGDPKAWSEL